jgi:hypothetical protein
MGWKTRVYDLALAPLVAGAAIPMRAVRALPTNRIPITFSVLRRAGVFPILAHYYEPLFDPSALKSNNTVRYLPGIDFAIERQIALLAEFKNSDLLNALPKREESPNTFYMENGNFESGDAEIWFHVIRHFKPARLLEIGSGHSTRMARFAIDTIMSEDTTYICDHVCIEPYEMPWLEQLGVRIVRQKLEDSDPSLVDSLQANDILFIDSSHMIRPQGEVLQEFLQILPRLRPGVIVHVHDIFSPRDYPMEWLEIPRFWNEQYLLEAFLTHNDAWETLLALNMLKHDRYQQLKSACPHLHEGREPGSFYMRRL